MQEITFQGTRIQFDPQLTRRLWIYGCPCDQCNFADISRSWFAPAEQHELIQELGAKPNSPVLQWAIPSDKKDPRTHWRFHAIWVVRGQLIGAETTPVLKRDRSSAMWVTSHYQQQEAFSGCLEDAQQKHDDLLYIHAINLLPWIPSQLASFRNRMVDTECERCRFNRRLTGYLTRSSLIPEWFGVSDVQLALRNRHIRVYAEFCPCGGVRFTAVPRKRPYYRRDLIYKAWLKDVHANHPDWPP